MRLQWRSLQKAPSNVSIGLAYELLVMKVLQSYSFHIRHTGRKGDRGQDFIGHWVLPDQRVPVVGEVPVRVVEYIFLDETYAHYVHAHSLV